MKTENRIEYKFILKNLNSFLNTINVIGFKEIYSKRKVNSLYLDTKSFSIFNHNLINDVYKKTIRIRHYDSDTNICKIEEKINVPSGKYKNVKEIKGNFNDFANKRIPIYKNYYPSSLVNYDRRYFIKDEFRITVDFNIVYNSTICRQTQNLSYAPNYSLVELKLNKGHIDEFKTSQFIPIKHSKYENSVRKLYKKN